MWKFAVVLATLFVYALSLDEIISLTYPCAIHFKVSETENGEALYEAYHMNIPGWTAYVLEYWYDKDLPYYRAYHNVFGYPGDIFTNESGSCVKTSDYFWDDVYHMVDYDVDPTEVACPANTQSTHCMQYCSSEYCVIVDSKNRMIENHTAGSLEGRRFFTYYDDIPTADIFTVTCGDDTYTAMDYCAPPSKVTFNMDCAFHAHIDGGYFESDSYWMKYEDKIAYVLENRHELLPVRDFTPPEDYYVLNYFYGGNMATLTNFTGECVATPIETRYRAYYITEFEYYGEPVSEQCPDHISDCLKYCHINAMTMSEECVLVDSDNRMVQYVGYFDVNSGGRSTATFTYLDGTPTTDTFAKECGGDQYEVANACATKNKIRLHTDCLSHFRATNQHVSWDAYVMYTGTDLASVRFDYLDQNAVDVFYFDLETGSALHVSNVSGYCTADTVPKEDTPKIPAEFEYFGEPEDVTCPDNINTCKRYFNDVTNEYITVDNMRLVEVFLNGVPTVLEYYDSADTPSADVFTMECSGYQYSATDYCGSSSNPSNPSDPSVPSSPSNPSDPSNPSGPSGPSDPSDPSVPSSPSGPSSSPSNPSSSPSNPSEPSVPSGPSSASIVEAAVAVVIAGLMVALL